MVNQDDAPYFDLNTDAGDDLRDDPGQPQASHDEDDKNDKDRLNSPNEEVIDLTNDDEHGLSDDDIMAIHDETDANGAHCAEHNNMNLHDHADTASLNWEGLMATGIGLPAHGHRHTWADLAVQDEYDRMWYNDGATTFVDCVIHNKNETKRI